MKDKMIYGLLVLLLVVVVGAPAVYAEAEFEEVYGWRDDTDSDPSEFEGDSESMPGERAPEYLPMDDAPGSFGVGIE